MSKGYKIKRSRGRIYRRDRSRARTPAGIIGAAVVVLALFGLGWLVYAPIMDLMMGKEPSTSSSSPSGDASASQDVSSLASEPSAPVAAAGQRMVYVPPDVAAVPARLEEFLLQVAGAGYNAVLLDVKDAQGILLYDSKNEQAQAFGAVSTSAFSLQAATDLAHRNGLQSVARMYTFEDHQASRGENMGIRVDDGRMWLDNALDLGGQPWLDPYRQAVWEYHLALANECIDMGVDILVADGVQFPPPDPGIEYAAYQDADGRSKEQVLTDFVSTLHTAMEQRDVPLWVAASAGAVLQLESQAQYGNPAAFGCPLLVDASPNHLTAIAAEAGLPTVLPAKPYEAVLTALRRVLERVPDVTPVIYADEIPPAEGSASTVVDAQLDALQALSLSNYLINPTGSGLSAAVQGAVDS